MKCTSIASRRSSLAAQKLSGTPISCIHVEVVLTSYTPPSHAHPRYNREQHNRLLQNIQGTSVISMILGTVSESD